MKSDLEKLTAYAWVVRRAFEQYSKRLGYSNDLAGFCYEASTVLYEVAKARGVNGMQFGHGRGHWFLLLDGMIVDVTSTQFKQPDKVAVIPLETAEQIGEWWQFVEAMSGPVYGMSTSGMRCLDDVKMMLDDPCGMREETV